MAGFDNNRYSFLKSNFWQSFIEKNKTEPIENTLLSKEKTADIDTVILAQQIIGKQIILKKIPSWSSCLNLFFPAKIHLEQSSSELTAKYKSTIIKGQSFIDISGGFGVDSFFFGKLFKYGIHCEINEELQFIVNHNFGQLHSNVKSILIDGLEFLRNTTDSFDLIYVDPSRRNKQNQKLVRLQDCHPNVINEIDFLLTKGNTILIKTSPLLDIKEVITHIPNLKEIHIVAVNNECKELLLLIKNNSNKHVNIRCCDLLNQIDFSFNYEQETKKCQQSLPLKYLYEPNVSILKAGAFNSLANSYNVKKLHLNTHLYTSNHKIDKFPGRIFEIIKEMKLDKKQLLKFLESNKANISKRNFPMSVAEIRKKTGIKDGGNCYIFATTLMNNKKRMLICKKVV